MSKRKTVLCTGETSASRKSAPVLRQRNKMKQRVKNQKPLKRAQPVKKSGVGRYGTAQYKPQFAGQAQRLAQAGYTMPQLAEYFGVSVDTIRNWKTKYPDFGRGIGYGKVDLMVKGINCLQKLIQGAQQIRTTRKKNDDGQMEVISQQVIKHKPDSQAAKFYLTATDPQTWAIGNLKNESVMSMVASVGYLESVMSRLPKTDRKAIAPPPEYPPQVQGQVTVITQMAREDVDRIVAD